MRSISFIKYKLRIEYMPINFCTHWDLIDPSSLQCKMHLYIYVSVCALRLDGLFELVGVQPCAAIHILQRNVGHLYYAHESSLRTLDLASCSMCVVLSLDSTQLAHIADCLFWVWIVWIYFVRETRQRTFAKHMHRRSIAGGGWLYELFANCLRNKNAYTTTRELPQNNTHTHTHRISTMCSSEV